MSVELQGGFEESGDWRKVQADVDRWLEDNDWDDWEIIIRPMTSADNGTGWHFVVMSSAREGEESKELDSEKFRWACAWHVDVENETVKWAYGKDAFDGINSVVARTKKLFEDEIDPLLESQTDSVSTNEYECVGGPFDGTKATTKDTIPAGGIAHLPVRGTAERPPKSQHARAAYEMGTDGKLHFRG